MKTSNELNLELSILIGRTAEAKAEYLAATGVGEEAAQASFAAAKDAENAVRAEYLAAVAAESPVVMLASDIAHNQWAAKDAEQSRLLQLAAIESLASMDRRPAARKSQSQLDADYDADLRNNQE